MLLVSVVFWWLYVTVSASLYVRRMGKQLKYQINIEFHVCMLCSCDTGPCEARGVDCGANVPRSVGCQLSIHYYRCSLMLTCW